LGELGEKRPKDWGKTLRAEKKKEIGDKQGGNL